MKLKLNSRPFEQWVLVLVITCFQIQFQLPNSEQGQGGITKQFLKGQMISDDGCLLVMINNYLITSTGLQASSYKLGANHLSRHPNKKN